MSAEAAKQIRAALKKKGWTSRDISVRSDSYSMGSSVDVRIKNPAIPLDAVRKIATEHERVHRDSNGEILGGGNTYVDTAYTSEALAALAEPWTPLVQNALNSLTAADDRNLFVRVGNSDVLVGYAFPDHPTPGFQLSHKGLGRMHFLDAKQGARYVAEYMRWQQPERHTAQPGEPVAYNVVSVHHDRRNSDVWLAVPASRLPGPVWRAEFDRAKDADGWYSRAWQASPAGFAFLDEATARAFAAAAPTTISAADTANGDVAARLRDLANGMQDAIDHALRPMTQNWTHKRGSQYAYRLREGHQQQQAQRALRVLADHHEAGTVPAILQNVRTKKAVADLTRTRTTSDGNGHTVNTEELANPNEAAKALRALVEAATSDADRHHAEVQTRQQEREKQINELRTLKVAGFFPTPPALASLVVEAAEIGLDHEVLEPSAGIGSLVEACPVPGNVTAVEACSRFARLIRGASAVQEADFLTLSPKPSYDRVVMNPPFERQADIDHVRHAWEFLKPGGRLVAVMSAAVRHNTSHKATEFRDWLANQLDGEIRDLPAGAFSGPEAIRQTDVSCVLLIADKPSIATQPPVQPDSDVVQALLDEVLGAMRTAGKDDCVGNHANVRHNLIHATARYLNTILAIDADVPAMAFSTPEAHE